MAEKQGDGFKYAIYLNDEPVDNIPPEALEIMAERLSKVVSEYFRTHPDEYEPFLKSQAALRAAREANNVKQFS